MRIPWKERQARIARWRAQPKPDDCDDDAAPPPIVLKVLTIGGLLVVALCLASATMCGWLAWRYHEAWIIGSLVSGVIMFVLLCAPATSQSTDWVDRLENRLSSLLESARLIAIGICAIPILALIAIIEACSEPEPDGWN